MTIVIVATYFVLTVLIGVVSKRRMKNARSFEGYRLSLFVCAAASTGEWLGGTATTGVSEYGYLYGISGAWYTVANALGICFLALFFARLYRRLNTTTVPEIIGRYLGTTARLMASLFLTFVLLIVGVSQMLAVGTLGQTLLGLSPKVAMCALGAGVLLYTVLGGMNAVGSTNILHLVVMYGGVLVAVIFCGKNGGITDTLPPAYFSPMSIGGTKIVSWLTASVLGACTAQAGLQPILKAKDEKTAVRASFMTASLVAPFGILTALLGMFARVRFPALENAKHALPALILTMPNVLAGLVLASVLAAVLSTAAPIFLSCGTLVSRDICAGLFPNLAGDEKRILFVSRTATLLCGIACICSALLVGTTTILDIVYFAYSLRGGLFIILLLAIFWKRMTANGAVAAMTLMAVCGGFWVIYKKLYGIYPIPFLNETYIAILTALLVSGAVSIFTKKNEGYLCEKQS